MKMTRTEVAALLATDPTALAEAVTIALIAAGSEWEWNSQTMEYVLSPLQNLAVSLGLPEVGSCGDDDENLAFWNDVAASPRTG